MILCSTQSCERCHITGREYPRRRSKYLRLATEPMGEIVNGDLPAIQNTPMPGSPPQANFPGTGDTPPATVPQCGRDRQHTIGEHARVPRKHACPVKPANSDAGRIEPLGSCAAATPSHNDSGDTRPTSLASHRTLDSGNRRRPIYLTNVPPSCVLEIEHEVFKRCDGALHVGLRPTENRAAKVFDELPHLGGVRRVRLFDESLTLGDQLVRSG